MYIKFSFVLSCYDMTIFYCHVVTVNWIQLISTGIFTMEGGSLAPGGGAALRPKTGRSEGSAGWIFTFHSKWSISGVNFNPNRSIKFSQKGLKGKKHDEKWYPIGVYLAFEYPNRGCTGVKKGGLKGGTSLLTLTEGMPPLPPAARGKLGPWANLWRRFARFGTNPPACETLPCVKVP